MKLVQNEVDELMKWLKRLIRERLFEHEPAFRVPETFYFASPEEFFMTMKQDKIDKMNLELSLYWNLYNGIGIVNCFGSFYFWQFGIFQIDYLDFVVLGNSNLTCVNNSPFWISKCGVFKQFL